MMFFSNLIPWMRCNYLILIFLTCWHSFYQYSSHIVWVTQLLFSKQNKSRKWNRKVGSRGSSRNTFQVIKSLVVQTYKFTSKYSIFESESDAGDGTSIVSPLSSECCFYWAWGCSGCSPRSWRGSSCRGQGDQAWTCDGWSNNTPHPPHRPCDTGSNWELTPGRWLPDPNRIIVTMCVLNTTAENNKPEHLPCLTWLDTSDSTLFRKARKRNVENEGNIECLSAIESFWRLNPLLQRKYK
mgnify:CR=1 FL=1